jgi:hypothetical protein
MLKQKSRIQIAVVICGLLIASSFENVEGAKTSKSKSKSSSSSSSGRVSKPSTNTQASHANPASFSYGNVKPNAPQPSAPVQQSYAPKPAYNQPAAPSYPAASQPAAPGWNVGANNQARPPYPVNNNQQFGNPPPQYSPHPNPGPPPAYGANPGQPTNFNQQPPAYRPPQQQPAYPQQQPAYPQQPAYSPQQPAYHPQQPAYQPQPNFQQPAPAAGGFAPQQPPQVINNYHITPGQTGGGYGQPQSSGPGLLKTAVVAGAAGLGGAALYNAFKPDNDPKTTVVYVTQPPAAAPVAAAEPVTQAPVQQPAVQPVQPYPQQPYPQQSYPQQPYPYDPNNPQQYNPQQQPYSPQPYDPNQQQQYNPAAPVAVPVPAGDAPPQSPPAEAQTAPPTIPVAAETTAPPAPAVDSTVNAALTGSSTSSPLEVSSIPPPEITTLPSSTILANNPVSAVPAKSERMGEVVEQKMATVVDQPVPKPSESKVENAGAALTYSVTLFLLSFAFQFVSKSLL